MSAAAPDIPLHIIRPFPLFLESGILNGSIDVLLESEIRRWWFSRRRSRRRKRMVKVFAFLWHWGNSKCHTYAAQTYTHTHTHQKFDCIIIYPLNQLARALSKWSREPFAIRWWWIAYRSAVSVSLAGFENCVKVVFEFVRS